MNLEAEGKLKFDRRLYGRDGWVSQEELRAELERLPNVAEKVRPPDEGDPSRAREFEPPSETR